MAHQFRTRLVNGELLIGTVVTLSCPEVAEVLAVAGFDWLFVDAEHSPLEARDIQALLQGAGPDTPCLVRLTSGEQVPIKKALDIGAAGIIAPQINSAEQAQAVVRFSKYSPQGIRGVGIGRAHGYGLRFQEYVDTANESITVVVQVEHVDAVENIEAIVSVPGIDGVLIGPYDLSASMGKPGRIADADMQRQIETVRQACLAHKVALGIFGVDAGAVRPFIEKGFSLLAVGMDTLFLGQSARQVLSRIEDD